MGQIWGTCKRKFIFRQLCGFGGIWSVLWAKSPSNPPKFAEDFSSCMCALIIAQSEIKTDIWRDTWSNRKDLKLHISYFTPLIPQILISMCNKPCKKKQTTKREHRIGTIETVKKLTPIGPSKSTRSSSIINPENCRNLNVPFETTER